MCRVCSLFAVRRSTADYPLIIDFLLQIFSNFCALQTFHFSVLVIFAAGIVVCYVISGEMLRGLN